MVTWSKVGWGRVEKVKEARAAIKLGEEECCVGLRFWGVDPLEARSYGALIGATFSENTATIAAESHGANGGRI